MKRSGLKRKTGLSRTAGLERNTASRDPGFSLAGRTRLRPVSEKRQQQNRVRAAMADRRWPDRRDGTVLCAVWEAMQPDWCDRYASDLHEIVRRSQGGSITDEENTTPTCRPCNGLLSDGPDWGYRIGVIKHDALCCQGRRVCAQYATDGEAA